MAVYTKISDNVLRKLLLRYDIGTLESVVGITDGVSNTNYLLTTSHDKYIFTIYENGMNVEELPFFLGLMEHLSSCGIPCPVPICTDNGKMIQEIGGQYSAIVTFLNGKWPKVVRNHNCKEAGRILAKMHTVSKDFLLCRENTTSVDSWRKRLAEINDSNMSKEIKPTILYLEENWPLDLPKGIIHADFFPDNALFSGEKLSGMIDFYLACNDFFAYDVAIALNAWCFEKNAEFNITKAKALLRGYNSIREFTKKELEVLPILAAGAAMRFLLSRLYDWNNRVEGAVVIPKDPDIYLKQLRFHMQVKTTAEYGL